MSSPTIPQLLRDLIKAKAKIEAGWLQGDLTDEAGNVSALGAVHFAMAGTVYPINVALVGSKRFSTATKILMKALEHKTKFRRTLYAWNDHPKTTKEEVLGVFDCAILSVAASNGIHVKSTVQLLEIMQ